MKVLTKELKDKALDWAVAKIQGAHRAYLVGEDFIEHHNHGKFQYSIEWAKGGPIIEAHIFVLEDRETDDDAPERWMAQAINGVVCFGQTPLVASMRAYVTVQLGTEVDVPAELLA